MPRRKHIAFLWIAALVLFSGCKTKLTQFTIAYGSMLENRTESADLVSFSTPEMKTDCRVRFERNDTKRSKVKRIHLQKLSFTCNAQKSMMAFVRNLKNIYISSPSYAEHKIAFRKLKTTYTNDELIVELEGSSDELINFIKQDRFVMRFEFETADFPEKIDLLAEMTFFVEGELIKTNLYHKILV